MPIKLDQLKNRWAKKIKGVSLETIVIIAIVAGFFGFLAGTIGGSYFYVETINYLLKINDALEKQDSPIMPGTTGISSFYEAAIIKAVEQASPAVVSIVISKDVPIYEQYYESPFKDFEEFFGRGGIDIQIPKYRQKGTEKQEVGGGTGFIVSNDGMILTNKHVVLDDEAEYAVFTNDGEQFSAKVLAKDPFQDLAVLKIEQETVINDNGEIILESFPVASLGNSDNLKIGQPVITIGNALGEFRNTVAIGIVSGLGRTITASSAELTETLEDVIQTDAAINRGNSGGPLLDLRGKVIGISVAKSEQGENIGFAIPVNYAKKDIEQVKTLGRIATPFLGVYYTMITETLAKDFDLSVDYGAWVGRNIYGEETDVAVFSGSAAQDAGIQRNDIILEFGNEKITMENNLAKIIRKYNPSDKAAIKILRNEQEMVIEVTLGEHTE